MTLNLVHFPGFKRSFFGADFQNDILDMLVRIRDEIGCRHIMHAYRGKLNDRSKKFSSDLTVVTSAPTSWMSRYATTNYFAVDPLFQEDAPYFSSEGAGVVRDLSHHADTNKAVAHMFRDAEKYGLGNVHLAVSVRTPSGLTGCTQFSFDVDDVGGREAFIEALRPALLNVAGMLHKNLCGIKEQHGSSALLTQREIDCLHWAACGKTDSEIAEILSIARWTVVTYLQNAKIKLNCSNRTSAVVTAISLGVIDMPEINHTFN